MPGKLIPIDKIVNEKILYALVPAIAKWQHVVVEAAAFLEPKLTGDLAATVTANEPKVAQGRNVTGRVHTQRYYARWQETKEEYKHTAPGQAHAMQDSVLLSISQGVAIVREAVDGIG